EQADIPPEVTFRPKWEIALGQVGRAVRAGVAFDWLSFDEEYGKSPDFLSGLTAKGLLYVGEAPCSWWCFARPQEARHPSRADDLVRYSSLFQQQPWREIHLPRQTLGEQVWKYKAARVWASQGSAAVAEPCWLIWAVNEQTGEEKYFVSNAAAQAKVE